METGKRSTVTFIITLVYAVLSSIQSGQADPASSGCDEAPYTYCLDHGESQGCKCYPCADICPEFSSNSSSPRTAPSYQCLRECSDYVKLFERRTSCNQQVQCKTWIQRVMDKSMSEKLTVVLLVVILALVIRVYCVTLRLQQTAQEIKLMCKEHCDAGQLMRAYDGTNQHVLVPDLMKSPKAAELFSQACVSTTRM
ncbi:uncharacterized protein [Ptychodera flava]|uniref:uncharacterized protein n=1 Tax=Ptychodera flava TaxID=63121 RepID=UPI00396A795F